jgi:hypothetical protein
MAPINLLGYVYILQEIYIEAINFPDLYNCFIIFQAPNKNKKNKRSTFFSQGIAHWANCHSLTTGFSRDS